MDIIVSITFGRCCTTWKSSYVQLMLLLNCDCKKLKIVKNCYFSTYSLNRWSILLIKSVRLDCFSFFFSKCLHVCIPLGGNCSMQHLQHTSLGDSIRPKTSFPQSLRWFWQDLFIADTNDPSTSVPIHAT